VKPGLAGRELSINRFACVFTWCTIFVKYSGLDWNTQDFTSCIILIMTQTLTNGCDGKARLIVILTRQPLSQDESGKSLGPNP
jgi:hypothetical protein